MPVGMIDEKHAKDKNKRKCSMEEMSRPLWCQAEGLGPGHC